MNILTGNTIKPTYKQIKAQYIAVACGVALGCVLVATSGRAVLRPTHTGEFAARPSSGTGATWTSTGRPEVAFYLVATDEQAKKVQEMEELAQWVRYGMGIDEPRRSVVVLPVRSTGEETRSRDLIEGQMAASNFASDSEAPTFTVTDMR